MYSLNVPVPGEVSQWTTAHYPELSAFDRVRERHSLTLKRFESMERARLRERLTHVLSPAPAFEVQVTGIDFFERPVRGPGPVVYFAVESPGLLRLHDRLVEAFGAVEDLEGDDYTPHVTLARGGRVADAERLAAMDVEPITWTASRLDLWNSDYRESVARIPLPRP
ncbi:2'-5' RNA ligase family protein [Salinirarus marinus]|uniref:2'-5' RNA ligase family protein n=1 Tax=Salinirarus marinus TaxID=3068310 RepID=UPI003C6BD96F